MKKTNGYRLPRISADNMAIKLKQGMGTEKALRVATGYANTLSRATSADVNTDIVPLSHVQKQGIFWSHVRHILANQKGYTAIEVLCLLSLAATFGAAIFGIYVVAHFLSKIW